jgi:membrane protease YdiL (CAAX protease family)
MRHTCPLFDDVAIGANHHYHSLAPGDMAERGSQAGHAGPARTVALEMTVVTAGTIATIKLLNAHCPPTLRWLAIPGVLVGAALIPTWIRRRELPNPGLGANRVRPAVRAVCCVCACTFPIVFLGLWLLRRLDLPIPLQPIHAGQQAWFTWLLYQFLYVAAAEEMFFRGYVQTGMMRLVEQARPLSRITQQRLVIAASAACFAVAHVIIHGQIISALVFFPGLVMAWLYVRTRSLWAPILFHGLANAFYGVMALALN